MATPARRRATYQDIVDAPEHQIAEIIDGELFMSPRPAPRHSLAASALGAWPKGCNQIDIIRDKLFTNLPYMQGAFFYKDVAAQVGADVLDGVIGRFYRAHANKAASMQDMLDAIKSDTGFDPTPLAEARLRKQF